MPGRLMPVFTAGHAGECAPNIKTTPISKRHMKRGGFACEVNNVTAGSTAPRTPRWRKATSPLCWCIKEDLISLWLKMTLASQLTLS